MISRLLYNAVLAGAGLLWLYVLVTYLWGGFLAVLAAAVVAGFWAALSGLYRRDRVRREAQERIKAKRASWRRSKR